MRKSMMLSALIGLLVVALVGAQQIDFTPPRVVYDGSGNIVPSASDSKDMGLSSALWRTAYVTRSIQGAKSVALTDEVAADITLVAITSLDGVVGVIEYGAIAKDAGDVQAAKGSVSLAAINDTDTEVCTVGVIDAEVSAVSVGTLSCVVACDADETNAVMVTLNCDTTLTTTAFTGYVRYDLQTMNALTPQ
jgi:hypothetical protein